MPAKVNKKTVLGPLCCVMIFVVRIDATADKPSSQHTLCLRECSRLARGEGLQRKSQIYNHVYISCHRKCLFKRKVHRIWNVKARNRRQINTIQPAPVCPEANQSVMEWRPNVSHINASIFQYENSDDWFFKATWPPMEDRIGIWKNIVFRLQKDPDDPLDCYILPKNQTSFVANLTALNYTYDNDIFMEVHSFPFNSTVAELRLVRAPVTPKPPVPPEPTPKPRIIHYVVIAIGAVIGSVLCIYTVYRILQKPRPEAPEGYEYAAFIVFSYDDREWMQKILHLLEEQHLMKCCVHFRDFQGGVPFVEEMARCINNSQKVLVLFSKHFLKSKFGDYEMKLAIHRMAQKRDDCLVIIKIDDVDRNNLPPELISNSFIDCTSPLERPFWKSKVLKLFGRPRSTSEWISDNNNEITVRPAFLRNWSIETQISTV
ncbi:uncharacterized protein [Montipora capricornis]|uniref:uncharacterized protein n=1 Tax=Montipora capricornis TaxID=246305 RepID=UPI0035F1348D